MAYKRKKKPKIKEICEKHLRLRDYDAIVQNLIKQAKHSLPAARMLLSIIQQEDGAKSANKKENQIEINTSEMLQQILNEEDYDDEN